MNSREFSGEFIACTSCVHVQMAFINGTRPVKNRAARYGEQSVAERGSALRLSTATTNVAV
eukprot:SAG11_NODE_498_length_8940_cov_11.447121_9_plen_61_part_00